MFQESFMNANFFMQNFSMEPLSMPESTEDVTMLSEALHFNEHGVPESYLDQITETLIIYAGPRETLIKELELLDGELTSFSL